MSYIDKVSVGGTEYDVQDHRGDNLALVDGYYEQMSVGNAEQLVSTVGIADKVPYNFRTSGGSADIGDRVQEKVIGGTIAWNQLLKAINSTNWGSGGVSNATFSDGVATFTASEQYGNIRQSNVSIISGHKYLISYQFKPTTSNTSFRINMGVSGSGLSITISQNTAAVWNDISTVKAASASGTGIFYLQDARSSDWDAVSIRNAMFIDLTQMFGSTIADYINTLETTHEGDGVAWFRKLFPKPYYAYNAGELMSVQAASHKMTGFNQWDEQWDVGDINSSGVPISGSYVRSKNFIPAIPGVTYCFTRPNVAIYLYQYDANKNFVPHETAGYVQLNSGSSNYELGDDTYYLKFVMGGAYGTTYNNDICINLHWDGERDGEYEPYSLRTYALDSDLVLRGIPKLDADNKLFYDGDVYESNGTVTRRFYQYTFTGEESWTKTYNADRYGWYQINLSTEGCPESKATDSVACQAITTANYSLSSFNASTSFGNTIGISGTPSIRVSLSDMADLTAEQFASRMAGVMILYELATPTTETADTYQNPQIVDDWGTEEYVDAAATAVTSPRDVSIPVGHDSMYRNNLRAKLEMAPESPDGDGDYIVRQSNGENVYVPITFPADELPAAPTTDGDYVLKCTVSSGTATFTWASE